MKKYKSETTSTIIYSILILLLISTSISHANENILRIAGWDVYSDPLRKDKTIGYKSFEKKYNITIQFKPLNNLDAIIDFAETDTNFDIFIISNEGIRLLHDMDLVEELDLEKLPNYQSLHHNLRLSDWSMFNGSVFAVPWAWGPTGLLYNEDIIKNPVSWSVLWDPKYKGRVALWNDVSMIWTTALYLGYKNVYSLTRDQLRHVKGKLLELNKNVYGYYNGEEEELKFILEKDVIAMNSWFDPSSRFKKKNLNFRMIIPDEGAVGMFDSYLIRKTSIHKELSHKFIDHQISPSIQKQMTHITGLAPANIETLSLMSGKEIKALHLDESDYFNKIILWDHMPRKHLYEKVITEIRNDLKQRTGNQ